jgi:hypothetical protein
VLSRRFREFYDWETRVDDWIRCFDAVDHAAVEIASRTRVVRKIERLVETRSPCSKKAILDHLGWHVKSRHISWNKYRKYLRRRFHEDARSPTVVFTVRKVRRRPQRNDPN